MKRLVALFLLPDQKMAGEIYDGLFCHEDILDFLYLLIFPESQTRMKKFLKRHRIVAPTSRITILLTQSTYLSVTTGDMFDIKDRW